MNTSADTFSVDRNFRKLFRIKIKIENPEQNKKYLKV